MPRVAPRNLVFAAAFAVSALAACAASASDAEKSLAVAGFDKIAVDGVYDLTISVGGPYSVRLTGPQADLDRVVAEIRDGALVLDLKGRNGSWFGGRGRRSINAYVTTPVLVGLDLSGVASGEASGISADNFKVAISGVGDLKLSGACRRLVADVSGVGDLDAKHLQCAEVAVTVSGVGDASVFASEAVDVAASGVGDIHVTGSPKKVRRSGSLFADISVK